MCNIKQQVRQWAESHPDPDDPLFYAGALSWTPREIHKEVQSDTEFGIHYVQFFVHKSASEVVSLKQPKRNVGILKTIQSYLRKKIRKQI